MGAFVAHSNTAYGTTPVKEQREADKRDVSGRGGVEGGERCGGYSPLFFI